MLPAPDEPSEDEVITAALAGSLASRQAAFAELVRVHTPPMERYLRSRRLNDAEIEDIIQETWLRVFRGLFAYRPQGRGLQPWLFGVVKNVLRETVRKRLPLASDAELVAIPDDYSMDELVDEIEVREFRVWLEAVLPDAPEAIHQYVEAHLAGLEPKEIMEYYGWTRSKTDTTKHRAIVWLKERSDALKRE